MPRKSYCFSSVTALVVLHVSILIIKLSPTCIPLILYTYVLSSLILTRVVLLQASKCVLGSYSPRRNKAAAQLVDLVSLI
jgi:hypothetical protein